MADTIDPLEPTAVEDDDLQLIETPAPAAGVPAPTYAPAPALQPTPTYAPAPAAPAPGGMPVLPNGITLASPGKKLGAALLDGLLIMVTFYLGWLIWGAIVASKGQTPGRQLLGLKVVSLRDGKPLSWGQMVFVHGLVGAFVSNVAFLFTLGVLAFMPLWDAKNQTVADKVAGSIVVDDPMKVYG